MTVLPFTPFSQRDSSNPGIRQEPCSPRLLTDVQQPVNLNSIGILLSFVESSSYRRWITNGVITVLYTVRILAIALTSIVLLSGCLDGSLEIRDFTETDRYAAIVWMTDQEPSVSLFRPTHLSSTGKFAARKSRSASRHSRNGVNTFTRIAMLSRTEHAGLGAGLGNSPVVHGSSWVTFRFQQRWPEQSRTRNNCLRSRHDTHRRVRS